MNRGPGDQLPDYELPDHESVTGKLSEIQGDDPMILTLARGHYCPKEHQQHLELAAHYPKIAVAYPRVLSICGSSRSESLMPIRAVGASAPLMPTRVG